MTYCTGSPPDDTSAATARRKHEDRVVEHGSDWTTTLMQTLPNLTMDHGGKQWKEENFSVLFLLP